MSYREDCPVVLQRLEDGWTWTANCRRPRGHEGGHLSDLTRVAIRWEQEDVEESEKADSGVVCRNGEYE